MAKKYKNILFSAVNCVSNRFLCKTFQNKFYPTIKYLDFSLKEPTAYEYPGIYLI